MSSSRDILPSLMGALIFLFGVAVVVTNNNHTQLSPVTSLHQRRSLTETTSTSTYSSFHTKCDLKVADVSPVEITLEHLPHRGEKLSFQLPQQAADWCMSPSLQALDFQNCDPTKPVNRLPLMGGMTNALKMVLLGVIESYEEGRCFFVDESQSHLTVQAEDGQKHSLIKRYFEPMGLDANSIVVRNAILEGRVETKDWTKVWVWEKRRVLTDKYFISHLANQEIDGHRLKFITLMKLWRPLTLVRNTACLDLEQHGLNDDYLAFSVSRGDKHEVENFDYPTADAYIVAAERVILTRFEGVVPKIFVATDDCVALSEFRGLRPDWTFVSQCDLQQNAADHGFAPTEMKDWSEQATDQHYVMFMTELFGLSIAKHVIGVTYTNVSWWVFLMRRADMDGMEFLDTIRSEPNAW